MKKKLTFISIFIIGVFINLYNFTDVFGDTAIPKVRLFGTSTTFADSTNYITVNKSMYILDSFKVSKDLYVGVKGGVIYLDTNRSAKIEYVGNTFKMTSSKSEGGFYFDNTGNTTNAGVSFVLSEGTPTFTIYKYRNGQLTTALSYDTLNGLYVQKGDIYLSSTTNQIKLPSDTASDYDANDAITLNRQSGIITSKSLTTAVNAEYNLTLTNSLINTSSKVFVQYRTGSHSQGTPIIRAASPGSGSVVFVLRNIDPANALNGTVVLSFVVFN